MTFCRTLRSVEDLRDAERECRNLGLCTVPDSRKHWDNLIALEAIRTLDIGRHEPIVDLGCRSGIILTWLHQLGYRRLYGCDLRTPYPPLKAALSQKLWRTAISGLRMYFPNRNRLRQSPVEHTGFPAGTFAAATCMSVIEHGVNVDALFREAARLLRPGGLFVLSTDYWPEGVEVGQLKRFAETHGYDRIFNRGQVMDICRKATVSGLSLLGTLDLEAEAPVIESDGFRYTFVTLAFRRVER